MTTPRGIAHAEQVANEWLRDLGEIDGMLRDREKAYAALRVVLHQLRDRLSLEEAVHLGAQLPTVVRGMYYGSWKPSLQPRRLRTADEFVAAVAAELQNANIDPQAAVRAVFALLSRRVDAGEIDDVRAQLPGDVERIWREAA